MPKPLSRKRRDEIRADFKSFLDYRYFEIAVKQRRYILPPLQQRFIKSVLKTALLHRKLCLNKDSVLWRAQLGCTVNDKQAFGQDIPLGCDHLLRKVPYPEARMKPLSYRASEGRVNPKGIPVLNLSRDRKTAMSEVRPSIGDSISIAKFRLIRDISIVNCSLHDPNVVCGEHGDPPEQREDSVWKMIDEAYSKPVSPSDQTAEYAPTQILAEAFKAEAFDGIAFKSSVSDALNIALFDLDLAKCGKVELAEAKSLKYTFRPG
jgi:hypothetical protein